MKCDTQSCRLTRTLQSALSTCMRVREKSCALLLKQAPLILLAAYAVFNCSTLLGCLLSAHKERMEQRDARNREHAKEHAPSRDVTKITALLREKLRQQPRKFERVMRHHDKDRDGYVPLFLETCGLFGGAPPQQQFRNWLH